MSDNVREISMIWVFIIEIMTVAITAYHDLEVAALVAISMVVPTIMLVGHVLDQHTEDQRFNAFLNSFAAKDEE